MTMNLQSSTKNIMITHKFTIKHSTELTHSKFANKSYRQKKSCEQFVNECFCGLINCIC